jgi:stearoyl-CoA desaturase (delta-9 desaturase)
MATARLAKPQFIRMGLASFSYLVVNWFPIAISCSLFAAWNAATGAQIPVFELTVFLLIFRQINIFTISSLFHRCYSHRQFDYHPTVEYWMRRWNWLWMGTGGRAWATLHRWHHAEADSDSDPHSPTKAGGSLWNITAQTARGYTKCIHEPEAFAKYSKGLPDDRFEDFVRWFESRGFWMLALSRVPVVAGVLFAAFVALGLPHAIALPAALFCLPGIMGSAWYSTVIVVNGLCHLIGYRIWDNDDTSTNLFPIDFFGWGEALHHNHHERQSRANLGHARWEFDAGFWMLWLLSQVGIVRNLRP